MSTIDQLLGDNGVRRTIGRYAHYIDQGDFAALSELFLEEAELVISVFDKPAREPIRGRDAIRAHLSQASERRHAGLSGRSPRRHHVSSVLVSIQSPATATSKSYFVAVTSVGTDHWGRYEDTLRLVGSEWLFERRDVHVEGRQKT